MNYDSWLATCREYKSGDSAIPEHVLESMPDHFDAVHVFEDGGWIVETDNNYWCNVAQFEIDTGGFEQAARFLWENHSRHEVNRMGYIQNADSGFRYLMFRKPDGHSSVCVLAADEYEQRFSEGEKLRLSRAQPVKKDGGTYGDMVACTVEAMDHWEATP